MTTPYTTFIRPGKPMKRVYLWVYQEVEDGAIKLHGTFLSIDEAKNTFGGYFAYTRYLSGMNMKGLLT